MAALYRGPLNLLDAMAVPALLHVTFAAIAALLVRMRAKVPKGHGRRHELVPETADAEVLQSCRQSSLQAR